MLQAFFQELNSLLLFDQTKGIYETRPPEPKLFPKQIAFNVIPHIDSWMEDGSTKEEWKMAVETKKILDPTIEVSATCVRVPVFVGHAEAVNVEFEHEFDLDDMREALADFEGVLLVDDPTENGYVTPVECIGEFGVFVSRLRRDTTVPSGLSMWVVSDNLRKGAALNAIQIAELLVADGHL
jgi:aspartate-semialdehyde dehydrogenase